MYSGQPHQFPARPPKKGLGCFATLAIIAGLGVIVFGVFCVAVMRPKSAAEKKRDDDLASAAADAEAQEDARLKDIFRKQCNLKPNATVFPVYAADLREHCHDMIRESLKVPGSGDFPSSSDEDKKDFASDDGCNMIYRSWVDAKNALGVKVRTRYACTYNPRIGLYSMKTED